MAAESRASKGGAAILIDEIQHFADWASRIKGQYDRLKRKKIPIHIVATGSSALLLGVGSRESLAGRFERLTLSHWSMSALSRQFNLSTSDAALFHVRFGSYPGSLQLRDDPPRWRAYVRDSIIEPAIGRDVLALQKYDEREHRRRAAPPKLVVLNTHNLKLVRLAEERRLREIFTLDDHSTAQLMIGFCRNLKTMTKVEGLRQAQLAMIWGAGKSDLFARRGVGGIRRQG